MVKSLNLLSHELITHHTSAADLIGLLLRLRGIENEAEFLQPSFPEINLPLSPAVKLIHQAIKAKQNILIYGDYDVDGITATAILWQALYQLTKNVTPYIPHRQRDGYGIKAESFFRFQQEKGINFDLLITVDNGIVAGQELQKIKAKQDIKIIITDHHLADGPINAADAVVLSNLLSGSAVSWFLAREFDQDADLGLAALGTVADCLPLTGVNRSIVVHGLQSLNLNPSPGIKRLIQVSAIKNPVSAYDLGFILGPRLNAIGRLADPTDALRLLCSQNPLQATKYAHILNSYNQDRQVLQKESLDEVDKNLDLKNKILFVSGEYHHGIIGLIAGRLTEKYYLPSVVIGLDGDIAKGSCRSIPELNIIEALRQHQDLFIDLGGHPGAAGFSLSVKNIPRLQKAITKTVNQKLKKIHLQPHLDVDAQMDLAAVTLKNIKALESLSPFGIGNPEPLFLFKDVRIDGKKLIGYTGDHLKLDVWADPCIRPITALAFKKGDLYNQLNVGETISFVASLSLNEWNNLRVPQLIVKEIIS